uniref:Paxillin-like isoform X2 n=1 Tax=Saccoglossus kowalevskii TaxID=10224 RepID=A0ABM0LW42_SACKO|nr:PREDICTED: paxillin-like isoform X2 [Saccoglossus kowalevskii]
MDDLDALLADLQTATSHLQPKQPPPPLQQQTPTVAESIPSSSYQSRHPPQQQVYNPSPGHPSYQDQHYQTEHYQQHYQQEPQYQPSYQRNQVYQEPIYQPTNPQPPTPQHTSTPKPSTNPNYLPTSSPQHTSTPKPGVKLNYQPSPSMTSSMNHNLSELDSLLEDLQAAQYTSQLPQDDNTNYSYTTTTTTTTTKKAPPVVAPKPKKSNGNQPVSPTSPTHDVLDAGHGSSPGQPYDTGRTVVTMTQTHHHPVQHQQSQPVHAQPIVQNQAPRASASNATKELDDLMASLSDFKMSSSLQTSPQHSVVSPDSSYATPQKQSTKSPAVATVQQVEPRGSQLDSMLGHLQTDMNRHGVQTVPKGHCAACNKPIVGQLVTALGKTWHPEHFTCSHCQTELGTQNFFERDGQPFCDKDYHNLFSPRCAYCHGPILEKCVTALDKTWHPEHFFCAQCGRHFADEGFHEKDGKAFCRDDYFDMFAPKCAGCNRAIMENYISALNVQWHPECFVCTECRTPFNGGSFFDHEGHPYCEIHYHAIRGSLCSGCNKPITGRCITAMQKKFHPEHFVCAFCLKQLNKGTFKEQNDKPYCHPCFVKLFG